MKPSLKVIVLACIGTLVFCAIYTGVLGCVFHSDWRQAAQFGESFGALSSLFTGLAFVVLLATLMQQSRQIKQTRRDMADEHELQKRTAELVHQQAEALALVARLNALTARIEACHVQIQECVGSEHEQRMRKERFNLLLRLDEILRSHGD